MAYTMSSTPAGAMGAVGSLNNTTCSQIKKKNLGLTLLHSSFGDEHRPYEWGVRAVGLCPSCL